MRHKSCKGPCIVRGLWIFYYNGDSNEDEVHGHRLLFTVTLSTDNMNPSEEGSMIDPRIGDLSEEDPLRDPYVLVETDRT